MSAFRDLHALANVPLFVPGRLQKSEDAFKGMVTPAVGHVADAQEITSRESGEAHALGLKPKKSSTAST